MPFTVSHAAVVLPFARLLARWRLLSAAVIGAMVPDFGLLLPWRFHRFETHSALGLATFCLPVGLASYWLFQFLVKPPLLEVLPDGAYARWRPYSSPAEILSPKQWLLAACGVLAGAVSHLVWDAFTHEGARGARMIPWLEDPIVDIGNHHLLGTRLLQDGSSLLGLMMVLGVVWYGLRRGHGEIETGRLVARPERRAWVMGYLAAGIGLSAAWFVWSRSGEAMMRSLSAHSVTIFANGIAIAALRGSAMGLIFTSLALDLRLRALRQSPTRA